MSMFSAFEIAGSAMSAQAQRMNVTASNMANADSVAGPDGETYRAKQVMFETQRATLQSPTWSQCMKWST